MKNKYIIIKDNPIGKIGDFVEFDNDKQKFFVFFNDQKIYFDHEQIKNSDFFIEAEKYPDYYAYHFPVFSRREVLEILKKAFPNKTMSGKYEISASKELYKFEQLLREQGYKIAEKKI